VSWYQKNVKVTRTLSLWLLHNIINSHSPFAMVHSIFLAYHISDYFLEQKPGLKYKPSLEYRPGVWRNSTNRGRALNTSRALNISQGSWLTPWSSLTGMHCLHVISVHHGTIWSYQYQYFGFFISNRQSKPLTKLLTNVLIVFVKYTMLSSVRCNVDVLIQARPWIQARPRIQAGGLM